MTTFLAVTFTFNLLWGILGNAGLPGDTGLPSDDGSKAASEFLAALKKNDESAICDAMESLAVHDGDLAAGLLIEKGMSHSSLMVHEEALRLVRTLKSEDARDRIVQIVRRSRKFESRMDAMRVLKSWSHNDSRPELIGRLADKTDWVVSLAIQSLRDHPHSETVTALIDKLPKAKGRQAEDIVDILEQMTGEKYPAETAGWKIWWEQNRDSWSPLESSESDEGEKKDVSTAVKDGLYGEIASERVVFLLDVSGSMLASTSIDDSRMEIAKVQLKRVLQGGLTPTSKFTVVAFLGLLHHMKIAFQIFFISPTRAVNALQHFIITVTTPISAGQLCELKCLA